MVTKKNLKKVINCPLGKEKYVRSECPAVKNVRSIRTRLNTMIKEEADQETIEKFRTALKNAKTGDAKKNQCKHCYHNTEN